MVSLTLATLALVSLTSAVPFEAEARWRIGVVIPLHQRNLTSLHERGVVIPSVLTNVAKRIQDKYAQGNAVYRGRTGEDLFTGVNRLLIKRQKESLVDEKEALWAGEVSIGTPAQSFLIDFDTGSADFWVPSSACASRGCKAHKSFDTRKSSSARRRRGKFSISYGDGSTSSGPIYSDTVSIAGLTAKNQFFSAVTSESSSFARDPSDGLLGLAFSSISQIGRPTFIDNLKTSGAIKKAMFAFKLAPRGSQLYIGGTDQSLYTGGITYVPLKSRSYWLIAGSASVDGSKAYNGGMIIDSGTTLVVGSSGSVAKFWKAAGGKKCRSMECGGSGFYTYDCAKPPNVAFGFGKASFEMSAETLSIGTTDETKKTCVGSIIGMAGVPGNAWIVGDSFMKNVYTVFDQDNKRVGFAKLA